MGLVGVAQRVGRDVARQVETQLRPQQARAPGWLGRENELDVGAAARLEFELLADGRRMRCVRARLSSVRSTCMMLAPKSLRGVLPKLAWPST